MLTYADVCQAVGKVDVVVSCLASRTGGIKDSNDIDYMASKNCLDYLIEQDGAHYVLLSGALRPRTLVAQGLQKLP
jgi:divinyl chlorophyllide a 8-vinyl-reductase